MSRSPFSAPGLRAWGQWLRSWLRPTVALYLPAQAPEQVFEAWCRAHLGTPVRLLLAGDLTHQALVPAPAAASGWSRLSAQTGAKARMRAVQDWALHYGDAVHAWPIATWSGAGLDGSCALHGANLDALGRCAQAYGVRLQSVVPLWAALLPWADAKQPQWCKVGKVGRAESASGARPEKGALEEPLAVLAVVEGALLTWVQCSASGVRAVLQRRLATPSPEALEHKMHSLRAPRQRVLVVGFGLDGGAFTGAPTHLANSANAWQAISPLDASGLPGPLMGALARPAGYAARRWPQADLLRRPGSLGLLGRGLALVAWLGLAGSAALWQQSHDALAQAQHQHVAAAASLQSARAAQRSPAQSSGSAGGATGATGKARPAPSGDVQAQVHLQARKVMAGLRYAWAGVLLPIEATASGNVRWLELDCSTDGGTGSGRVRLLGQANTTAAALEAVQTLSAQSGWSQVALSKMQDRSARDPQGGVRFELTALYHSAPPALATEAH